MNNNLTDTITPTQPAAQLTRTKSNSIRLLLLLSLVGPGLVVMLADTDAGSIITAAQSGAIWGYKLLLLQVILIPVLYVAQELTVRLGLVTGKGHACLIKLHFGKFWAWLSVSTLVISCLGALISEFSGIASVGLMFGIPIPLSVTAVLAFLIIIAISGSYKSVERVALAIGAFELVFLIVAVQAHPSAQEIIHGIKNIPWRNPNYLYLMAANIGAVIMPWMIFYQQSAVIDKGLIKKNMRIARWDTAIGAVLTQVIMISVLVATAATIGKTAHGSLNTVQEISNELTPYLGVSAGRILFAMGMLGASLVAAIVVTLSVAWGLGEVMGYRHSLSDKPTEAPKFYGVYTIMLLISGLIVSFSHINLVNLNVAVEVMNALLLPIVLGFLYLLALKTLPEKYRLKGGYAIVVGIVLAITAGFGVFGGLYGIF